MSSYFQMGHQMENLVGERDLGEFSGIILSPVNRSPSEMLVDVGRFRASGEYDIIIDPQLYFPHSNRGKLREHCYFPEDFETADVSSPRWWGTVISSLADFATQLKVSGVASPVILPRRWNLSFYAQMAEIANNLSSQLHERGRQAWTTVIIDVNQIVDEAFRMEVASVMSSPQTAGYYIVFVTDQEPRREIADEECLFGMMSIIRELSDTGRPVIVSHCSSDMLLFKYAGASSCATGKFFNLRRFTKGRYEEPAGGGGQLPYWFEHSLVGFLREADIRRLQRDGFGNLIGNEFSDNYWGNLILSNFVSTPGDAWLGDSWRHFLSWFGKTERDYDFTTLRQALRDAENHWEALEEADVLMEERANDGNWIRSWRQALGRFHRVYDT